MADREGFEPSGRLTTPGGLANHCLKPLGHLSIWCARRDLNPHVLSDT